MNADMLNTFVRQAIPFVGRSELNILEAKPGYVKLMMPFSVNKNHVGSMYAGAQFTLAEITGGIIFMSSFDPQKFYPLVKEVTIRYKAPMTSDATVEAYLGAEELQRIQMELDSQGKSDFTLDMQLMNTQGEAVALVQGLYQGRKTG